MKPPKSQPYQRSRHRAALHAWVVAATAVASVGMPSVALAGQREELRHTAEHDELTPAQSAQRVAADWLSALQKGDVDAALDLTAMPKVPGNERAVFDHAAALSDWLVQSETEPTPIAHQHAGHWALSAWRLDPTDGLSGDSGLLEPITLYHPTADALSGNAEDWRVVPQGFADDPALSPLINADYTALMGWYQTLA